MTYKIESYSKSNKVLGGIDYDFKRNDDIYYFATIRNTYLQLSRVVKGYNEKDLIEKIETQFKTWADKEEREKRKIYNSNKQEYVESQNKKIQDINFQISDLLKFSPSDKNNILDIFKCTSSFNKIDVSGFCRTKLSKLSEPVKPSYKEHIDHPDKNSKRFQPRYNLIDIIFKRKEKVDKKYNNLFLNECAEIDKKNLLIDDENSIQKEDYTKKLELFKKSKSELENKIFEIEEKTRKETEYFISLKKAYNDKVADLKEKRRSGDPEAVTGIMNFVLRNIPFPDFVENTFSLSYDNMRRLFIVNYKLPSYSDLPRVKEYKYIASKQEIKETLYSEKDLKIKYENIIYSICFRIIKELYSQDKNNIKEIVFNGFVEFLDKTTRNLTVKNILSLRGIKENFDSININNIDPILCFESLNGIVSKSLDNPVDIDFIESLDKTPHNKYFSLLEDKKEVIEASSPIVIAPKIEIDDFKKSFDYRFPNIKIKGLFYRDNKSQIRAKKLKIEENLILEAEPDNQYDKYAVRVLTEDGIMIGYIDQIYSADINSKLDFNYKCLVSNISNDDVPFINADIFFIK